MSRARHTKKGMDGKYTPCMKSGGAVRGQSYKNVIQSARGGIKVDMPKGKSMSKRLDRKN